jgi:hypothetical protein
MPTQTKLAQPEFPPRRHNRARQLRSVASLNRAGVSEALVGHRLGSVARAVICAWVANQGCPRLSMLVITRRSIGIR